EVTRPTDEGLHAAAGHPALGGDRCGREEAESAVAADHRGGPDRVGHRLGGGLLPVWRAVPRAFVGLLEPGHRFRRDDRRPRPLVQLALIRDSGSPGLCMITSACPGAQASYSSVTSG